MLLSFSQGVSFCCRLPLFLRSISSRFKVRILTTLLFPHLPATMLVFFSHPRSFVCFFLLGRDFQRVSPRTRLEGGGECPLSEEDPLTPRLPSLLCEPSPCMTHSLLQSPAPWYGLALTRVEMPRLLLMTNQSRLKSFRIKGSYRHESPRRGRLVGTSNGPRSSDKSTHF